MDLATAQNDLRAILADGPYSITLNGATAPCMFFDTSELALPDAHGRGEAQIVEAATATVVTADFPNVKGTDPCVITTRNADGSILSTQNFKVWRRLLVQDGQATELVLRRA